MPSPATPAGVLDFRTAALRLGQQGYHLGPPPWITTDALLIDRECCQEAECEECGQVGLRFEPFHHLEDHSYLGLAVCPHCLIATEF